MSDSILLTIKKLLGDSLEDDFYNTDIIIHINSAFSILNQLGFGPPEGYLITGPENVWSEVIGDSKHFETVKTYVYFVVKRAFDPPATATMYTNINSTIQEYEWRIMVLVESEQL